MTTHAVPRGTAVGDAATAGDRPSPRRAGGTVYSSDLARALAVITLFALGVRQDLHTQVTSGFVLAFLFIPLWAGSVRRFGWGRSILWLGVAAVAWGFFLPTFTGSARLLSGINRNGSAVLLLGTLAGVGVVLWARRMLSISTITTTYGLGMVAGAVLGFANPSTNAWKYAYAVPVAVTLLGLAARRGNRWLELVVLLGLMAVSAVFDSRSYLATFLVVALLVVYQQRPRLLRMRGSWLLNAGFLAGLAAAVYYLGTSLLVSGYLGQDAQTRTISQIQQSGSVIVGGRPELEATLALMRADINGFGLGVLPTSNDILVAKQGMASVGYQPNNGYVERYMFGGQIELHSMFGDMWATYGLLGLAFVAVVVLFTVRGMASYLSGRTASAVMLFCAVWTLWNVGFSPLYASAPTLLITLGIVLLPAREKQGLLPAHRRAQQTGAPVPDGASRPSPARAPIPAGRRPLTGSLPLRDPGPPPDGQAVVPGAVELAAVEPVDDLTAAVDLDGALQSRQPDQLGRRTARGAAVTLGGQALRAVLQMATVVVLARLLAPGDYGLLALVLVVVGVGEILRDFGLSTAAIQAKVLTTDQRDMLFWLNVGLGVAFALIAVAIAPLYASLFHHPQLEHMIQVVSLTFVINGCAAQFRADLNRRMRFGRIAASDVLGQAAGLAAGVLFAVLGAGYWALVIQQLAQMFTALVVLAVNARWLPARPRRGTEVGPLVRMGSHLAATRIIYYFLNNLDTLTIGLRFSSGALGSYNRAFQLMNQPLNQMLNPATTVALPVLSRLQDDYARAAEYIKRAQVAIGYSVIPVLAIAAGAASQFVALLLGPQWSRVVPMFALLAVAGCLSTLAYVGRWVYLSRGMARDLMRYTSVSFVLQLVCILVGSEWGVVGVAWGYLVASALEWPLSLFWLSRLTPLPVRDLYSGALRICLTALGAGLVAWAVSSWFPVAVHVLAAAAAVLAGAAWYLACGRLFRPVRGDLLGVLDFGRRMVRR